MTNCGITDLVLKDCPKMVFLHGRCSARATRACTHMHTHGVGSSSDTHAHTHAHKGSDPAQTRAHTHTLGSSSQQPRLADAAAPAPCLPKSQEAGVPALCPRATVLRDRLHGTGEGPGAQTGSGFHTASLQLSAGDSCCLMDRG